MIGFQRTTSDNYDFSILIANLDAELLDRYPETQSKYAPHNKIENNNTVVVAYSGVNPVGCGCFKKYSEDTVEIKRMYVLPGYRGKQIALHILQELESWAKEHGFTRAILETGIRQPEAIGLYKKAGYSTIENYGPYVEMPLSICMQKLLFHNA